MERVNSAKKDCKEGAVCGLVESKESKFMLVLFLHSSHRKKKLKASLKQSKKNTTYKKQSKKPSTFSPFQHHREFALKSKTPVAVKTTPEDKAIITNSRKKTNNDTKATVEVVDPQPEEEIHFPYVIISAAPWVQVDCFQFRVALMRVDLQGQQGWTTRKTLQQRRTLDFPL